MDNLYGVLARGASQFSPRKFRAYGLIFLLLAGCSSPKTIAQIGAEVSKSVVLITYGDKKGQGTGFLVKGGDGVCTVLTVAHVAKPSQKLQLTTTDQKLFKSSSVKLLSNVDLAVITFDVSGDQACPYPALELGSSEKTDINDPVLVVGYPTRAGAKIPVLQSPTGKVTAVQNPPLPDGYSISYDALTVGGMSGSPVLDVAGKVVAVHGLTDAEIVGLAQKQQGSLSSEQSAKVDEIKDRLEFMRLNTFRWGIPIKRYSAELKNLVKLISDTEELLKQADKLYSEGKYQKALEAYNRAIKLKPDNEFAYKDRGVVRKILGDTKGAIADYDNAIQLNPNFSAAYNNRGIAISDSGDTKSSITDYDKAITINQNWGKGGLWTGYFNRGVSRSELGDEKGAITDYDKAIQLKPDWAEAYHNRGNSRFYLGDKKHAIADYDRAIQLKPDFAKSYYARGVSRFDVDDKKGAIADYDKAIQLKPDWADAYNSRGISRSQLGDKKGAIIDYDKAIQLKPNFAEAFSNRGISRYYLSDNKGAVTDYDKAIQLKPDFPGTYFNRGLALESLGNKQLALKDFQQAANFYERQGNTEWLQNARNQIKKLTP